MCDDEVVRLSAFLVNLQPQLSIYPVEVSSYSRNTITRFFHSFREWQLCRAEALALYILLLYF